MPAKTYLAAFMIAIVIGFGFAQPSSSQELTARTDKDVEKIVREYLLRNPEVIVQALEELERRREKVQQDRQRLLISQNEETLYNSEHQVIYGNPDGDVTLIEFFDYNCGFCRSSMADIERLIEEDKNLKIVLKEFPVLGPGSQEAAQVAIAASKVDKVKYIELHKRLLGARGQVNGRIASAIADELGFDMDAVRTNMGKPSVEQAVTEVYSVAELLGVNGTPTFILGTEVIGGAVGYQALKQRIDAMRECGKTVCS